MQDDVGVYRSLPRERPGGRTARYDDGTTAELALFGGRLAWRVTYRAASDAVYDVIVDAEQRQGAAAREPRQVRRGDGPGVGQPPGRGLRRRGARRSICRRG